MTNTEQLLLAICVGAIAGSAIGNIIVLISMAVDHFKEKRRKKKEEAERASNDDPLNFF